MILEIKEVSKAFGGIQALNNINFNVIEGEIFGIIGPNGAGKTTLFNVISGFMHPDSGKIVLHNIEITRLNATDISRNGIARTFQLVKPLKELTVWQNVTMGSLKNAKDLKQASIAAVEVIKMVGLLGKIQFLPEQLTAPDLKRLELARALATNPKVLLLDEVIAGLISSEVTGLVELIKTIRSRGITILIVEHVMKAVMNLSDRILVLDNGRKIMEGTPEEVANDSQTIRAYLGKRYDTSN
jgi:branched-chain amino acid transport system ATP-binding protein